MVENIVNQEALAWLLEPQDAGVRYLALRDLVGLPADDPELAQARRDAHASGPIARVLQDMHPEGWWGKPGPGYSPKYRSSVWAMILLGQLGASVDEDARMGQAAGYMLDHALTPLGQFTCNASAEGTMSCLQGNLCKALFDMGVWDERLERAFDWMARSVTGDGVAPVTDKKAAVRYTTYLCGPGFACAANYGAPCAWGAVKIMAAIGSLPRSRRTPAIQKAVQKGQEYILSIDPVAAAYTTETSSPISKYWWKFHFPVFYVADLVQLTEAMLTTADVFNPRLSSTLEHIRGHQDAQGRVNMEFSYAGRTFPGFGSGGKPNKWVTLRVLRVLKLAAEKQS